MKIQFNKFKKTIVESMIVESLSDELARVLVETNVTIKRILETLSSKYEKFNNEKYKQYFDGIGSILFAACKHTNDETFISGMIEAFKTYNKTLNKLATDDPYIAIERYISVDDYGRYGYKVYPLNYKIKEFFNNENNLQLFYNEINKYGDFSNTKKDFKGFIDSQNRLMITYDIKDQ